MYANHQVSSLFIERFFQRALQLVVLLLGVFTLAMCCDWESVVVLALSLLCCRFNCGRWFARSDEDGSVERFLVAEKVPQTIVKSCSMSALSMYKYVHVFSSQQIGGVVDLTL